MRRTRHVMAAIAIVAASVTCTSDGPTAAGESGDWSAGTWQHATVVGSLTRTYLAHVPAHRRLSTAGVAIPWPLVIVLHGSSGDAAAVEEESGMDSLADAQRFVVAYPNGTGGAFNLYPSDWNSGNCCGGAYRDNIDDLGFIQALITEVSAHIPVDPRRIYVAGFSSGGFMAYHVGCQLSALVAAIAVVEGELADYGCTPTKPVPLWAVHGTDDPEVAYDAGAPDPPSQVPALAGDLPPSAQYWAVIEGCVKGTRTVVGSDVTRTSFTPCTGGVIDFYTILGGTHGWPGGPDDPGSQPPMNEINASELMWTFFIKQIR